MYHQERQLQQLRSRFRSWLPYLRMATKAEVEVLPAGVGNAFIIKATWNGGEHVKVYDAAHLLRLGYVSCVKDYARAFVKEVLETRGVL